MTYAVYKVSHFVAIVQKDEFHSGYDYVTLITFLQFIRTQQCKDIVKKKIIKALRKKKKIFQLSLV